MKRKKILIIQEDSKMEEAFTTLLKNKYDLTTAGDRFEAWEIFKAQDIHIDLIIMGLNPQRLGGSEFYKNVRGVNPWLPVIFVMASGIFENTEEAHHWEDPSCVAIPFESSLLLRKMKMLLNIFKPDISIETDLGQHSNFDNPKLHPVTRYIIREIRTKFNKKLFLHDMAEQLGMTAEHLCRTFRADCHMTPYRYLITLRINAAMSLLENAQYSIETIAELTGFYDHSHFIRNFKHLTGMPPKRFRYQARKDREKEK